ncbi:D-2-hydroxyglutarate dehydrogenase, mitochondrial-like [Euwallacea fornicatus]|uniref:D-2-hydroxyglutarate dehydrogenase, mitochondrial-like n=1 Tax=Euwallacea fornicatus TaxID=995702 RepID=UPI0033900E8A
MFSKKLIQLNIIQLTKNSCRGFKNIPDFTKNTYQVERGFYNYLQEHHLKFFEDLLGDGERVLTNLSDLEKYNVDWYLQARGLSTVVLKPKTTQEVSLILDYCNSNKLALCIQGGNTGCSAGGVPVFDEIVLSTELMNEILEIDEHAGIILCQAGVVLETLDSALAEKGLMVPLDLGSKGSCQIGGNIATNAGGMRLLRYGNMHGNVLGLETVKANGEVLDCLKTMRKDNSGLHIKNIFIGSEGTLGVITKVALHCPPRPKSNHVAFLGLQSYDKVLKTLKKARGELGEILSAIEVMDAITMDWGEEHIKFKSPLDKYPYYLLIETSGSNEEHDTLKINSFLESALFGNYILNGIVAAEPSKIQSIWAIREKLPEGFKDHGWVGLYDLSLPVTEFYTLVDETRAYLKNRVEAVFGFGHLGDGNIHLNVMAKKYDKRLDKDLENFLTKRVLHLRGSMSAEHGLGFLKRKYLPMANSPGSYHLMTELKRLLDPNRILNPYKLFP